MLQYFCRELKHPFSGGNPNPPPNRCTKVFPKPRGNTDMFVIYNDKISAMLLQGNDLLPCSCLPL